MGLGTYSIRVNGADCGIESVALGALTSVGGFLFGYDTGQISGFLVFNDFTNRFGTGTDPETGETTWVPITQSLMVSLMSIGSLIGALLGSYSSDWLGRRKNLTFFVVIFLVGNTIQITAMNSWVHMMVGRLVAGVGVGGLSVGVPMYQSECSPREIRGAVVASYQLMITIGILVSNLLNLAVRTIEDQSASWRIIIGLGMFFSLFLGVGVLFLPESPRWLASKHDWDGVRLSMARLRGKKDDPQHPLVEDDLQEMYALLEKEKKAGVKGWLACFSDLKSGVSRTTYRTLLGFAIHFFQQWTGINYFMYYGASLFTGATSIGDELVVQIIIGVVNVVCTFPGLWFVERFGRRWPLFLGALWQAAWLLIYAVMGTALDPMTNDGAGIAMIVATCMFIASFASTWGPFAWVVIGETFELSTRAKQASIATAGNWIGNFMIALLTPIADDGIGYSFGYVLVGTNLIAAAIVWFFLFESVSLSLENVSEMYADPNIKPWSSGKWVPNGYVTRRQRMAAGANDTSAGRFSDETTRPDSATTGVQPKASTDVRTESEPKQTV